MKLASFTYQKEIEEEAILRSSILIYYLFILVGLTYGIQWAESAHVHCMNIAV